MTDQNEKKDKKKMFDKVIMGAVIGGAIGSVLGASIAPKKGSETRKEIGGYFKKLKKFFQKNDTPPPSL